MKKHITYKHNQISKGFSLSLALISIFGFLGIAFTSLFGWDWVSNNSAAIILMIAGAGLLVESEINKWRKFGDNRYDKVETTHILSGVMGIFAIIAGAISFFGGTSPLFEAIKGIIAVFAIFLIAIETWVVK